MALDIVLFVLIIICLYTDLKERKIYNIILVPTLIAAISLNVYYEGLSGLWESLIGFLLGLGLLILPFAANGIGAGDVKLLGVIGSIKGAKFVFYCFIATGIVGGIIALIVLAKNGKLRTSILKIAKSVYLFIISFGKVRDFSNFNNVSSEEIFPYGLAIAIGTISTYLVV